MNVKYTSLRLCTPIYWLIEFCFNIYFDYFINKILIILPSFTYLMHLCVRNTKYIQISQVIL